MSRIQSIGRLQIPDSLSSQLAALRRKLWSTKLTEAVAAAIGGVALAYLALFTMDRLGNTPPWLRATTMLAAIVACGMIPYCLHRWIWSNRRFHQLARMLSRRLPQVGDQLLGVIELSESDAEQARSRELCQAAIEQVARDVSKRDLSAAVPRSYHRTRINVAAFLLAIVAGLFFVAPDAAKNTLARFLQPLKDIARYTFAAVMPLDNQIVVPHGEAFDVNVALAPQSKWTPKTASVRIGSQPYLNAELAENRYQFNAPGQIAEGEMRVSVGDWRQEVRVVPKYRPELSAVAVEVELPGYLEQTKKRDADARSGKVSFVAGSTATIRASINRDIEAATVDSSDVPVQGDSFVSLPLEVVKPIKHVLTWRDHDDLAGARPFSLLIEPRADEAPVVGVEGITPNQILLDSERLKFSISASDDFGVREIGMEWKGVAAAGEKPQQGEKLIALAGPEDAVFVTDGFFTATSLGIEPQSLELRIYVTDYLPGRKRAYSPAYVVHVLDEDEHAAWLTREMIKFQKAALEVRDREEVLYDRNIEIRAMGIEKIQTPEVQSQIAAQAAAESANGRRLNTVAGVGARLVQQAAKNPSFDPQGVGAMADMVMTLQEMANNRMPSIASLLRENAGGPAGGAPGTSSNLRAGFARAPGVLGRKKELVPGPIRPPGMALGDSETSHQPGEDPPNAKAQKVKAGSAALRMPTTTLKGRPLQGELPDAQPGGMDEVVDEQRKLLEDFARLANEMNEVLSRLEGATFVKRLKSASREQSKIAGALSLEALDTFGLGGSENDGGESEEESHDASEASTK